MAAAKTPLECTETEKRTPLECTEMEMETPLECMEMMKGMRPCILLVFLRAGVASGNRMRHIIMSVYSMRQDSCGG